MPTPCLNKQFVLPILPDVPLLQLGELWDCFAQTSYLQRSFFFFAVWITRKTKPSTIVRPFLILFSIFVVVVESNAQRHLQFAPQRRRAERQHHCSTTAILHCCARIEKRIARVFLDGICFARKAGFVANKLQNSIKIQ